MLNCLLIFFENKLKYAKIKKQLWVAKNIFNMSVMINMFDKYKF
ncbi:hypothetical protein CDSE_0313 [Candidatus Kinetoplastibacterium desouzaii TCC079E]|uniref:Uncharacterized protein n=1 Tax=Candidatus Kinetoplastidibacterium desouzai TCC079E TaxID=1208919 RepID=M1M300_9PROT|nr:hypothetical protein CDSE_0313 [Candidatus Kinetoplastibacterium desouzaii TCC079E]